LVRAGFDCTMTSDWVFGLLSYFLFSQTTKQ
jgi:hypothetical protein